MREAEGALSGNNLQTRAHATQLPWEVTPLLYSESISARFPGYKVYLKLDTLQPSQCFKQRTLGLLANQVYKKYGKDTHFVIASSGNAALSLAYVARGLGVPCSVFITLDAANPGLLDTLKRYGAGITVHGTTYPDALTKAEEFMLETPSAILMPSYDHPTLWEGSSSMIDEIAEQLPPSSGAPHAIVCSVGGGSMVGGIMIGCDHHGWDETRIIAIETTGADTLYHSVLATESNNHIVPREVELIVDEEHKITMAKRVPTTLATSLGATTSAVGVIKRACARREKKRSLLTCVSLPDEMAMRGCLGFADEHKMIVDLACGAALGPLYDSTIFANIFQQTNAPQESRPHTIVFIICGGPKVNLADMLGYQAHLEKQVSRSLRVWVDEMLVVC